VPALAWIGAQFPVAVAEDQVPRALDVDRGKGLAVMPFHSLPDTKCESCLRSVPRPLRRELRLDVVNPVLSLMLIEQHEIVEHGHSRVLRRVERLFMDRHAGGAVVLKDSQRAARFLRHRGKRKCNNEQSGGSNDRNVLTARESPYLLTFRPPSRSIDCANAALNLNYYFVDHARRLVQRVGRARAFQHVLCAHAASDPIFTTSSAPSFLPISSRRSRVPVKITGEAPSAFATPTPISPIGPGPITTTPSPAITPPITSSPYIAVPAVTIRVASA